MYLNFVRTKHMQQMLRTAYRSKVLGRLNLIGPNAEVFAFHALGSTTRQTYLLRPIKSRGVFYLQRVVSYYIGDLFYANPS